ncbi:Cytochrome P450 4C1 [Frankliniella fusca]|uniref:Cytochrome P450 4C1 n=1 Tax=Frankliniella fusca TaxID=407009 RepID=A0AAE1LI70_9NEOP|nr:Cytochrome P450 4C1 [Frankliniella fusca]
MALLHECDKDRETKLLSGIGLLAALVGGGLWTSRLASRAQAEGAQGPGPRPRPPSRPGPAQEAHSLAERSPLLPLPPLLSDTGPAVPSAPRGVDLTANSRRDTRGERGPDTSRLLSISTNVCARKLRGRSEAPLGLDWTDRPHCTPNAVPGRGAMKLSLPLPLLQVAAGVAVVYFCHLVSRLLAVIAEVRRMQKVLGDDPPGPRPLPLIGNVLELLAPRDAFWSKMVALVRKHAPTFRFWCGPNCFMVITHPRDFEFVLTNPKFNGKSSWYPLAQSALGTGLIVLSGEPWRRHRRAVAPSMHHRVLEQNVQVFERKAADLSEAILSPAALSGDTLDIKDFCNVVSMDAVCETLLSSDLSSSRESLKRFVDAKNEACDLVAYRVYNPWLLSDRVYALTAEAREERRIEALTDHFVDEVISRKRSQGRAETPAGSAAAASHRAGGKHRSFLEHALADSTVAELMTDEELREEAKAMVIAGEGTVARAMSFVLLMLAMHPGVQEAVQKELADVFGEDADRPVTEHEVPHLQYLERVILETLRLFPLVSVFGRDCPEDIVLPSGSPAPRGSTLLFFSFHMHRDPAWYPRPLEFDPDRFLPEQVRSRPAVSFAAFSAGPRSCIGQRYAMMYLKTVLATVLRRFEVHRPPGDTRTVADLPIEIGVILGLQGGFPVRYRPANQQGVLRRARPEQSQALRRSIPRGLGVLRSAAVPAGRVGRGQAGPSRASVSPERSAMSGWSWGWGAVDGHVGGGGGADLALAALAACLMLGSLLRFAPRAVRAARAVRRMRRVLAPMPGPAPLPLLGNLPELFTSQDKFWTKITTLMARYAPTFCFWLGPTPFVVITDPRDYDHVMGSARFNDKSSWYPLARAALGTGLITLSGEPWRRHRKAIAPSLHQHVLVQNVEVFRRKATELSHMLSRAASSGETVDILDFCNMVSMDSVCETLLSADLSRHAAALGRFVDLTTDAARSVTARICRPWLLWDRLYALTEAGRTAGRIMQETDAFIDGVISKRTAGSRDRDRKDVDDSVSKASSRRSFLEHALSSESLASLMTAEEWREEAKAMVVAGQGTVAHCLSFALLLLAMHPDVQHRLRQELEDVFGGESDRPVTEHELPHLQYTERVILETLRLFPLVPVFGRDCPEDVVLPSGHAVPRGAHLFMFTFHTQRDPAWFPEPLRFEPDRFLPEQVRTRPVLSFAAFSAGPRSCIGQRYAMMYLKTVLATVLRRFEVHRPPGDTRTVADLPIEIGVILSLDGGFEVRVSELGETPSPSCDLAASRHLH